MRYLETVQMLMGSEMPDTPKVMLEDVVPVK